MSIPLRAPLRHRGVLPDDVDARAAAPARSGHGAAWKAVGWFGLLLATIGLSDIVLTLYPLQMGRPEWEFGVVAASYASLPLVAMGMAGILASSLGQGRRWMIRLTAAVLVLIALAMAGATTIFLLDVPLALRMAPEQVMMGIRKTIIKTLVLGTLFPISFVVAAIAAMRSHPVRGR